MLLHELENSNKIKKHRKGRGISQGKGKTAGRGQKGQKARNNVRKGFEGGQTPLFRRIPKFGFTNFTTKHYVVLNFKDIKDKYQANETVSYKTLRIKKIISSGKVKNIKILGVDKSTKIKFDVAKLSYLRVNK